MTQIKIRQTLCVVIIGLFAVGVAIDYFTRPAHGHYDYQCAGVECGADGYVVGAGWGA